MTSIPADPSMVLGQIVSPWAILKLKGIAKVQQPVDAANDRFNAKSLAYYQMAALEQEMLNMGMSIMDVGKITAMKETAKSQMVNAAMLMATISIGVEEVLEKLKTDFFGQNLISYKPESPISLKDSEIKSLNLSFDSLKFDVQYFRQQSVVQTETSLATNVSAHVGQTTSSQSGGGSISQSTSAAVAASMSATTDWQQVEGTIVLTCYCTHKMADVLAPAIIDPERAVSAWNQLMPIPLSTDPGSMFNAATYYANVPAISGISTISVLTGVTRASTFVGMVHILKDESTSTMQMSMSLSAAVQQSIEGDMAVGGMTGEFGAGVSIGATASALMSTSNINNTASLVCMGVIPDIKVGTVESVVRSLNPDPGKSMEALGAIQGATNGSVNSDMQSMAAEGKTGAQYKNIQNTYLEKTVSSIAEYDKQSNSVIDTNTMFTAFESYIDKIFEGNGVGVPTNFFLTELGISDVAKAYIRTFYPNGAAGTDSFKGAFGQKPTASKES